MKVNGFEVKKRCFCSVRCNQISVWNVCEIFRENVHKKLKTSIVLFEVLDDADLQKTTCQEWFYSVNWFWNQTFFVCSIFFLKLVLESRTQPNNVLIYVEMQIASTVNERKIFKCSGIGIGRMTYHSE